MDAQRSAHHQHRSAVLTLLRDGQQLTRGEIGRRLGLPRTTVSEVLTALRSEGAIVVTSARSHPGAGRPAEVLSVHPGAVRYVGIDFSRSRTFVCLANTSGAVVACGDEPLTGGDGWERRAAVAIDLVHRLATGDIHLSFLHSIAIGLPGPNSMSWFDDMARGSVDDVFKMVGARVRELFETQFGVPVLVEHHIRFAALGEAATGGVRENLIYLRLSTGVGGAVVAQGTVLVGTHGLAGEIGHLCVDRSPGARACQCGRRGCLETVASSGALVEAAGSLDPTINTIEALATAICHGNRSLDALVRTTATIVGRVLGRAALVSDPSEIVLAGEVGRLLLYHSTAVQTAVDAELLPSQRVAVRATRLGDEAGAQGGIVALMASTPYPSTQESAVPAPALRRPGVSRVC